MLRCVWVRLSTTQVRRRRHVEVRRRRHVEAWRRHRRGAGSVAQGRGQRGGGSQARGSLSDLCVFVGCSQFCSEGPSPSWHAMTLQGATRLACNRPFRNKFSSLGT